MPQRIPSYLLAIAVGLGVLLYLLGPVLTPFAVAALLAYLGDPLVDRLEARGMSRSASVSIVFGAMTLILLLSGTTVTWAHHALIEGKQKEAARALAITVGLGVLFSGFQAYEYSHGHFGWMDGLINPHDIYASTFYMATGFHGLHVIIGTIFLAVCYFRTVKGHFTPKSHFGFEAAAWYWHFVDVVWLFLFCAVYWWGYHGAPH